MSSTTGSSAITPHLPECSVIPGDCLDRDQLEPLAASRSVRGRLDGPHLSPNVDGPQVEIVDPFVYEQDDLLAGERLVLGVPRDTDPVAAFMPLPPPG